MTMPVQGSNPTPQNTGASTTSKANPSAQQAAVSSSTTVANMSQLKTKAPKVYKAMVKGMMFSMISQMQDNENRLKQMEAKARRESERG